MKKFLFALAISSLFAGSAQAGILSNLIAGNGVPTTLEDNSRGLIFDKQGIGETGNGVVSVGDVITGLVSIDRRRDPTGIDLAGGDQLIIAYSFQVSSVVPLGGGVMAINYAPTPKSYSESIYNLLGADHHPVSSGDAIWDSASFVVLEKSGATNPLLDTATAGLDLIESVLGNGTGYTLDMIGGMLAGDFYDNLIFGGPGLNIAAIEASGNNTTLGAASGGLSILWDNLDLTYLPTEAVSVVDGSTSDHDLVMSGANLFGNNADNWDFSDKADFTLTAVPAPGSGLLLAGMLVGLVGAGRLRRKKTVLA